MKRVLTTSWGAPIGDNQNSLTAGENGPMLLQDFVYIDKIAKFDRERIPERVVHAKGAGAHGYFEVTDDVTKYTKAKFLNRVGKRSPVFVRFSTVAGERGAADTDRDPRGFAIKIYTEDGNYDIVGNNTPIFFIRDPMKFPDLIHSQKRNPQSNLKDPNAAWDFWSLVPESCHQISLLFSNRGTPDGYRHMNGYGSHTFRWVNSENQGFYIKYHFKTNQGIKNLKAQEAEALAGKDPDYATRDLYESIVAENYPSWTLYVQIMTEEQAQKQNFNILDVTKIWPHLDFPLIRVGKLELNRNPINYFQEVEQAAFCPGHLVPGIEPSNDKMLQGRLFSYTDTHRHRLGPNYDQIPINCPYMSRVANYQRDGQMCIDGNKGAEANYEPNSFEEAPKQSKQVEEFPSKLNGTVGRFKQNVTSNDFDQVGEFYRKVLDEEERTDLLNNIIASLRKVTKKETKQRMIEIFAKCDIEYGTRLAQGLDMLPQQAKL